MLYCENYFQNKGEIRTFFWEKKNPLPADQYCNVKENSSGRGI